MGVRSSTTTLARVWRRASSRRRARILQPWRRTTRRLASRLRKAKVRRRDTVTSSKKLAFTSNLQYGLRSYASERLTHMLLQVFDSRKAAGVALSIFSRLDD